MPDVDREREGEGREGREGRKERRKEGGREKGRQTTS